MVEEIRALRELDGDSKLVEPKLMMGYEKSGRFKNGQLVLASKK